MFGNDSPVCLDNFQMERRKDRDRAKDILRLNSFYFNDSQSPRIAVPTQPEERIEQLPAGIALFSILSRLHCGHQSIILSVKLNSLLGSTSVQSPRDYLRKQLARAAALRLFRNSSSSRNLQTSAANGHMHGQLSIHTKGSR